MSLGRMFLHSFTPAALAICLIAASSCTPAETESLRLEQPDTADDIPGLQVTPKQTVDEVIEVPAPVSSLLSTPIPDQDLLSGVSSRPLGITLLGLGVLCSCALGPILTIGLVIGVVIWTNRRKP